MPLGAPQANTVDGSEAPAPQAPPNLPLVSWIYRLVAGHPGAVMATFLGVTLLSLGAFTHVQMADEIESTLTDPAALATWQTFRRSFDEERSILIAWEVPDLGRATLIHLKEVVDALHRLPQVQQVFSLLDLLRASGDREQFAASLTDHRLRRLQEAAATDRVLRGRVISHDGGAIAVMIVPDTRWPDWQQQLCAAIDDLRPRLFGGRPHHVFGFPWFKDRFMRAVARNNRVFLSLSAVACAILAWIFFPDLGVLVMIVLTVAIPAVLTFAIYFMNGHGINLFTAPIIPFALVVSFNELIFIISHFVAGETAWRDYDTLHEQTFRRLAWPCFVNMVTTLIGFFALSSNPSQNIQLFSVYTSLACFLSYGVMFGFAFAFLKVYKPNFAAVDTGTVRLRGLKRWLMRFVLRHARAVLAVLLLGSLAGLAVATTLVSRNALEDIFPADDPLLEAFRFIGARFGGPYTFDLMISGDDVLTRPALEAVAEVQARVGRLPGVNAVFSVVDLVRDFTERFAGAASIPASPEFLRSIVTLYASRGLAGFFVSPDYARLTIKIGVTGSDDREILDVASAVQRTADAVLAGTGLRAEPTGEIYLNARMQQLILTNVWWAFGSALAMIAAVFLAVFRSLRLALYALLVNFLPILGAYALAHLAGLPLNPSTGVVGCVMSGLVVDDTLHLLTCFRERAGATGRHPVRRTWYVLDQLFHPVLASALLMGVANAIFLFSDFKPFRYFGGIGAVIVLLGIVGDLVALPALFLAFGDGRSSPARPVERRGQ